MLVIKFYLLDCDELLSYTKHDHYWPRISYLNYFEKSYIPPLRGRITCWKKNTFIEDYVEVKEENIEIYEEIMKALYRRRTSNQDCGGD